VAGLKYIQILNGQGTGSRQVSGGLTAPQLTNDAHERARRTVIESGVIVGDTRTAREQRAREKE
jgi:hypothetical protein